MHRARFVRLVLAAAVVCLIAACAGDPDEGYVRNVSYLTTITSSFDHPTKQVETIELTLPRNFKIDRFREVTLIDQKGRRFHWATLGLSQSATDEQRVRGTFEVAEDSEFVLLQLNEFDVDLRNNRIRRARRP